MNPKKPQSDKTDFNFLLSHKRKAFSEESAFYTHIKRQTGDSASL